MSLLLINRTTLLLAADALHVQSMQAGQAMLKQTLAWSEDINHDLQQALNANVAQASGIAWQRVQVLLADQHVHFSQVAAVDVPLTPNEQLAYTRACLVQTWGEQAQAWPFRLLRFPASRGNLLATLPTLDASALQSTPSTVRGLNKALFQLSAKPYATALLAHHQRPDNAVILVPEQQVMRLFVFQAGACVHVSSMRFEPLQLATLTSWVKREQALHGASQSPCQLLMEPSRHNLMQAVKAWQEACASTLALHLVYPSAVLFDWSAK